MKTWKLSRAGLLFLAVVTVLTLGCGSTDTSSEGAATEEEQAIAEKEQQLAELKEQVADLENELEESSQIAEMERQIAEMEQALAERREQASSAPPSAPENPPAAASSQAAAPPPAPEVRQITLAEGTPVVVRTTTEISTQAVSTGDTFEASLEEPLMDGATLIAPKGASVIGLVAYSDKGGRVEGRAQLEFQLRNFVTESGQVVDVNTDTLGLTAESSTKQDALKVGIASGIGAAIGAIAGGGKGAAIGAGAGAGAGAGSVLLTRGNAAVLPSESVLNFTLAAPVTITE